MPLVPPYIESLRPYKAGRTIASVRAQYGLEHVAKLASNENPLGPSRLALAAMRKVLTQVNQYPDGSAFYRARVDRRIRDLIARIAERDWEGAPLSTFFKNQNDPMWRPMTSLRDVDEAGLIRVAARDSDRHYALRPRRHASRQADARGLDRARVRPQPG